MEEIVSTIAAIPTISSGRFIRGKKFENDDQYEFELNLSIRKYSGDVTTKGAYLWRSGGSDSLSEINPNVKFQSLSPDGYFLLIGRTETSEKAGLSKVFIEIWSENSYKKSISLNSIHSDFCTDEVFSSFSWSPSGKYFVYVAEKLADEKKNFTKYQFVSNFGERLQSVNQPVICVLNTETFEVKVLDIKFNQEKSGYVNAVQVIPSQPIFTKDNELFFTGISVGSKKLGLTYIYCRPSAIYCINLEEDQLVSKLISNPQMSSRSPIPSYDGKSIVYLRNSLARSHFKASELVQFDIKSGETKILVKIVKDPQGGFPGIFTQRIPFQRFTDKVIMNTCWYDLKPIISVEIATGCVKNLIPNYCGSLRVLDFLNDRFLIAGATATCSVSEIEIPIFSSKIQKHITSSVIELNNHLHIVLLKPTLNDLNSKLPLIIIPHGGPNSVYSVDYVFYPTVLTRLNCAVASINFTGSIGFGDDSIEALEGQIGIRDVEDCYLALKHLLTSGDYDEERVIVMGGSHGGYLAAHLSAKYPNLFKGAILRNPVIDLLSMTVTSDISDWTFGQLGLFYDQLRGRHFTGKELELFQSRSPSYYAHQVTCSTLLMLGAQDLRVPPSQGLYWSNLLKANGVDCEVFMYPDANHGLETAESERFGLMAIINFLKENFFIIN